MPSSNNSTSMPSLYNTSTSASSTGSRSSGFFPKSYPKQPSSYYNQYDFASTVKNTSQSERVGHSELGWMQPLPDDEVVAASTRRRQQPVYAASEPGITHHQSLIGLVHQYRESTGLLMEQQNEVDGRDSSRFNNFNQRQFLQSRQERSSRGRLPDNSRNSSGSSDMQDSRCRSVSSTQRLSRMKMEPTPSFNAEATNLSQVRSIRRSSSPIPRKRSPSLDRSFYEKSSSIDVSFTEHSSEMYSQERSHNRPIQGDQINTGESNSSVHATKYYGRAEIETPTPTSVRDLKERLWDQDESLHHWHRQNERLLKSQIEPRRLGFSTTSRDSKPADTYTTFESRSTTSSTNFSMSPKPARFEESRVSALLSNPRYSRPAARVTSRSPSRNIATSRQQNTPMQAVLAKETMESISPPRQKPQSSTEPKSMFNRMPSDSEAPTEKEVKAESDVTAVIANKSVATLMAKISAVKRNDPTEALAQIDAILSAESAKLETSRESIESSRRCSDSDQNYQNQDTVKNTQTHNELSDTNNEDELSIAATSVSSITNPSYQPSSATKNMLMSFSNKPSLLRAYGSTAISNKDEWFRPSTKREANSLPPTTIRLANKDNARKPCESARQPRIFVEQLSEGDDFPQNTASRYVELADKIRRWDELSAVEITGVKSDDSGYPVESRLENTPLRRRPHPWDSSIPAHSARTDVSRSPAAKAVDRANQYKPKYTNRETKYLANDRRDFDEESNSIIQTYPSCFPGDDFERKSRSVESKSELEISQGVSQQKGEETHTMSFDSTWVSVPESSFFLEHLSPQRGGTDPVRATSKESSDPVAFSTPEHEEYVPRQPDVSSPRPPFGSLRTNNIHRDVSTGQYASPLENRRIQTFSPRTSEPIRDFHSLSPRAIRNEPMSRQSSSSESSEEHGVDVGLLKNKPKSRGFRSFLSKRRSQKCSTLTLDHNASYPKRYTDVLAMDIELPPPLRSRGRHFDATQDRLRSRSLDDGRSRNPNIGKKFGRLLGV